MLSYASSVVLNTLLCHHLSDCCGLCCRCCHKGRAADPGEGAAGDAQPGLPCCCPRRDRCRDRRAGAAGPGCRSVPRCPGCAVRAELLWLHQHRGRGGRSFAVREAGAAGRAGAAARFTPPKSVSGHCPQRPSLWMSLLCCRDRAAKGPGTSSASPANCVPSFSAEPSGAFLLHSH